MHTETSHSSPGFGRNTGGWGIVIVAIAAVLLALVAYFLWHSGQKEVDWYRLSASQSHDTHEGHESPEGENHTAHMAAGMADPSKFGSVDTKGNFIYVLGDTIGLRLPNGVLLKVPEHSTEARLIEFLIEDKFQVNEEDKTQGWITCDRIFFETGKDSLTIESLQQIVNLSTILKAFPESAIKVGGYTDSTANAAINMPLSEARAKRVADMLVTDGAENEIAHEGYGEQWPLASNTTVEGRAMNRRVDIRVTKK